MSLLEQMASKVAAQVGIDQGQAETATNMTAGFLTDKLPEPLADQVSEALGTTRVTGIAGDLVDAVVEKTGIPRETAETAVRTVADQLKEYLPAPLAENIYPLLGLGGGTSGDLSSILGALGGGDASGALGGLLGGLMGGGDKK